MCQDICYIRIFNTDLKSIVDVDAKTNYSKFIFIFITRRYAQYNMSKQ